MAGNSAVEWEPWPTPPNGSEKPRAWYRSRVPYHKNGNALQTVDIWTMSLEDTSLRATRPWMIYIHGGAWRDPLVDSTSFNQTVNCIVSDDSNMHKKIGGLASINYSLSPHPSHPTHPAPVPGPAVEAVASRSAKHPDHIVDCLDAIRFLNSEFGFENNYILVGHSCGATLAFQVAMNHGQWISSTTRGVAVQGVPKPVAVIGLNGLYDLPALIKEPGPKHQHLQQLYEGFTCLAFGEDRKAWGLVSPTSIGNWPEVWPAGKEVVLVQSHEDTLVPYSQTEIMLSCLKKSSGTRLQVREMDADGDHNDLWKSGARLRDILKEVLHYLS